MLTAKDFTGLYAIIPTPAKPASEKLTATQTVDIDETARLVDTLIRDGASGLIALGTTGECATLSWLDYQAFSACVIEVARGRVPVFIGTSALGGHAVAERMRFIREQKADGTLLGLPMWQPVTTDMAIDFFRQVSDAFPEIAVMVYANARAFRYKFPIEFWEVIARVAPTVTSAKFSRPQNLPALIEATQNRINFIPNEMTAHTFFATSPSTTTAVWATAAAMGPLPVLALVDAIRDSDHAAIDAISKDIAWASEPLKPVFSDPDIFASYNIQVEKTRINAAGYCDCGPTRPPYDVLPADYAAGARECGERWSSLQARYQMRRETVRAV